MKTSASLPMPGRPSGDPHLPGTPEDGFEELARAIWPPSTGDNPDTAEAPGRHALAQLLRRAASGIGSLPLAESGLGPDDLSRPGGAAGYLVLEGASLVLPRYASQLRQIRAFLEHRCPLDAPRLADHDVAGPLAAILPPARITGESRGSTPPAQFDNAQQRLAVAALVDAPLGVLTGGPGTGKTTTAAALLAVRHRIDPGLRPSQVLVAAPTGRAASRIGEAISQAADRLPGLNPDDREFLRRIPTTTLHRALEWGPEPPERGGPYRRNALRPLEVRMLLVDEASMVDLALMHALVRAMPADASLLLLGDGDQLESVEVGGVLAECVRRANRVLPPAWRDRLAARLGIPGDQVQTDHAEGLPPRAVQAGPPPSPLPGVVVGLHHSWRALNAPWILELAAQVRPGGRGTTASVTDCLARHASGPDPVMTWRQDGLAAPDSSLCQRHWRGWLDEASGWPRMDADPDSLEAGSATSLLSARLDALRRLGGFQLLCTTNRQVERANLTGLAVLWAGRARPAGELPHGCPVLVLANDRDLGLSNGDLGIALGEGCGMPAGLVLFAGPDGSPRVIPRVRLPSHQPAFGMTIHKSQGSEWDTVAIELPDRSESPLLTRNLLYTAITRARRSLHLFGPIPSSLLPSP